MQSSAHSWGKEKKSPQILKLFHFKELVYPLVKNNVFDEA